MREVGGGRGGGDKRVRKRRWEGLSAEPKALANSQLKVSTGRSCCPSDTV